MRSLAGWLLLAPSLIMLAVFVFVPYAGALLYSVVDAKLTDVTNTTFVGLRNFDDVITVPEPSFWMIVGTTALFTAGTTIGALGLGTVLAVFLHTLGPSTRAALLAILILPWVVAAVVIGYAWRLVYDPQLGLANSVLAIFGIEGLPWLLDRYLAILSLVVANVWAGYVLVLLVVSSALTNIPRSIILAAQVDGAGFLGTVGRVVLPNIRPALLLATLVAIVGGLNVFDLIFVMTGGGPSYQTETLALAMYRFTFRRGEVSQGAAVTVILFVLTLALAIAYVVSWQRESKKWA